MRILIIAATETEIQPFLNSDIQKLNAIDTLITGVGMIATTYSLAKKLSKDSYDLLLNVGIAGSFHENTPLGTVFRVKEDCFSELGAQNDNEFLTLEDLNLGEFRFQENCKTLLNLPSVKSLQAVNGITVNKVHGQESSIIKVVKQFSPDLESMEGASIFYVAQQEKMLSLQIRAISNLVEKRNKDAWDIPLAIRNLNNWLIEFIRDSIQNK
jgi:futalosine hydrolase